MAHVADWKRTEVTELEGLIKKYPVMAVSQISGLPASQFQQIRGKLRGNATVKVSKIKLLKLAMENAGDKKVMALTEHMEGPIAIIFTDMNSFKLFKLLKQSRVAAAAKAGQTAPMDIVVPKGDTGLPPGPALGDLKSAGINARIDGGSIKVMSDSVVVKEGETISADVAAGLGKLGLTPMVVGMSIAATFDEDTIYTSAILDISEEGTLRKLQEAHMSAFNLSFNAVYPTSETIGPLLTSAHSNARNLGFNAVVFDKGTVELLISKAAGEGTALASQVKMPEPEKKEEKPAEKKKEEAPAEEKKEKPAEEKKEDAPAEEKKEEAAEEKKEEAPAEEKPAEEEKKE